MRGIRAHEIKCHFLVTSRFMESVLAYAQHLSKKGGSIDPWSEDTTRQRVNFESKKARTR